MFLMAAAFIMGLTISPYTFTGIEIVNGIKQVKLGPGMIFFALFNPGLNLASVYILFKKYRQATGIFKLQMQYIWLGILVMLGLTVATILVPVLLRQNHFFILFAPLYALSFLGCTGYAMIKYRFMDVKLVIKKSASYIISLSIIQIAGWMLIISLIPIFGGYKPWFGPLALALGIISFEPLYLFISLYANKYFFQTFYDFRNALLETGQQLSTFTDIERITKQIMAALLNTFRLQFIGVYLTQTEVFRQFCRFEGDAVSSTYKDCHDIYQECVKSKLNAIFVAQELEKKEIKQKITPALSKMIKDKKIAVIMPLISGQKFLGLIFIGHKISQESFTYEDIQLLETIITQITPSVANAIHFEQLKQLNQSLEKKVASQVEKIKKLYEIKSEFLSISSHQLRTPLTVIIGMLDMLKNNDVHGAKRKQFIEQSLTSAENLNKIVNDILISNELEAGNINYKKETVNLKNILQETVNTFLPKAQEKGLKLTFNILGDKHLVNADLKIKEVFSNLIDNALTYTPRGEVTVILRNQDRQIVISVQDTGIGINQEELPQLFQKFSRGKKSRGIRPNGSGLGLFIAKNIVDYHKGAITAYSAGENKGSTFTVILPAKI